jgi:hypothetical protein
MHKIIHPKFELDLSSYEITVVEDNYWFSDQFFTKYSFPFTFELTDDLITVFGDILDDNAKFIETSYEVQYVFGNKLESAVFEIESQIGTEITSTYRFGFDELPNFDKKLSNLPLEETAISNIYTHAVNIIPQTWPAVNYNYPQIHTNEYESDTNTWQHFKNIINNYDGSSFYINNSTEGLFINRNIIQPVPYLLHVLKQGFLDAGFTLQGDILEDEIIQQILLFYNADYFNKIGNVLNYSLSREDHNNVVNEPDMFYYEDTIQLQPDSTYVLKGMVAHYKNTNYDNDFFNKIQYKNDVLVNFTVNKWAQKKIIDITFTTDSNTDLSTQILVLTAAAINFDVIPIDYYDYLSINYNTVYSYRNIFELEIERQTENESEEVEIVHNVDLTKVVPDITFGELIYAIKTMFNLELYIQEKEVFLNFIGNSLKNTSTKDLSSFLVKSPKKIFPSDKSYLLKFSENDSEDVIYEKILLPDEVIITGDIESSDSTTEIEIDTIPLPQKTINLIETACVLDKDEKNIYFVLYNGLNNNLNTTNDNSAILIPNLYDRYYKEWIFFLLNYIQYSWSFKMYSEEVEEINKKVFAYGRYHIVKTIDKTQISEDLFEVEIETATLP